MTIREKAERLLKEMPEEQVPAALEEVERYANTLKVLRKRHPAKSESDLMESLAMVKEGDDAIKLIRARFEGIPSEAGTEAIVTGDKDLLDHKEPLDPPALNLREACELLGLLD